MGQAETVSSALEDEERPTTLTWSLRLLGALVVFGGLVVLAMIWRHDDLLRTWAEGNSSARRILETQGLEALKNAEEGEVSAPHFIAPAITLYAVMVVLLWVLGVFYRNGFEWGRSGITAVLMIAAVCSIGGLMTDPPTLFVVATWIAIVIGVTAIVLMWLPPTTRYIHPRGDLRRSQEEASVRG